MTEPIKLQRKKSQLSPPPSGAVITSQPFDDPEQFISAFMESATVGLAIVDRQLRFRVINYSLAEMNGVKPQLHLGKTIGEILGGASPQIERIFNRVFDSQKPARNFELTALLPTRSQVGHWIENFFPIKDRVGRVKEAAAVVVEIVDPTLRNFPRHLYGDLRRNFQVSGADQINCSRPILPTNNGLLDANTRLACSLFGCVEQQFAHSIWRMARHHRHSPGEVFCIEGQPATRLFLLSKGLVKLVGTTRSGKEVLLDWMQPGEAFGVGALLPSAAKYLWTVVAVEESEALSWDRNAVRSFAQFAPQAFENALQIALGWAAQLQERFKALSDGYVEQRLAHLVLRLSKAWNGRGYGEVRISDEELAEMAGTNMFSVNKILSRWRRQGYIHKARLHLKVLDREHLMQLSSVPDSD